MNHQLYIAAVVDDSRSTVFWNDELSVTLCLNPRNLNIAWSLAISNRYATHSYPTMEECTSVFAQLRAIIPQPSSGNFQHAPGDPATVVFLPDVLPRQPEPRVAPPPSHN